MSALKVRQARKLWALGLDTFEIADVLERSEEIAAVVLARGLGEESVRLAALCAVHPLPAPAELGGAHG